MNHLYFLSISPVIAYLVYTIQLIFILQLYAFPITLFQRQHKVLLQ